MRSMMGKTTLREIRQSLGRYLAIFAIVALGVGFFAGLKITKTVMVESADAYLEENQLYDYRLLSTLGFEEEDVEAFRAKEDVRAAEGAVDADILYVNGQGNEDVIKAHSLLKNINGLKVTAGRLPEKGTECVVDSNLYEESAIGSKIVLSENNETEDLERFAYKEYTIVGMAQSSAYIQFERGTTSLGNGRVSGFMYLLPEGFAAEYYTEIYVKFDEDYPIYSKEYNDYIEEKDKLWETYCEEQGNRRYQAIVSEAETELADGEEKLKDGEKELADNKTLLDRKEKELSEARGALEEQKAALGAMGQGSAGDHPVQGYTGMTAQQAQAALQQLESAEAQIAEGEAELKNARLQLEKAEAEWEKSRLEIEEAKKELEDGFAEYNDAYAEFEEKIGDAEAEFAEAREEIEAIEKPDTYVLGRDTNIGYACFESDSSIVEGIANVFPVFFFLVAALVCMTTMNRMVEEQRMQIGVLKALGYGEGKIMGKYLFYSGSAALTGCIAGYFLGIHVFPLVIWTAYGMMYQLGDIVYAFDAVTALVCLVCALLCSMGTTWVSCRRELKEVAAGLMRPKAPKAGKRVFLERVPFIWKRLKFLYKVSVRNIVRYKKRFFMMVIGISGCTALLVTGFGVKDSVTNIADQQFKEIQTYQLGITLKDGIDGREAVSVKELTQVLDSYGGEWIPVLETTMDIEAEGSLKTVNLVAVGETGQIGNYIDLHTPEGEKIEYPDTGKIVVCEKIAERHHLKIGDTICLYDEEQNRIEAVVSGICENYIYNYAYVNAETYKEAMGELAFKNIYANVSEDSDVHTAGAAVMKAENVPAVSVNEDMLVRFSSMMSSMNYIVFVVIACAAALAFIVLYNLNNINITERIREIATIKVLGFYRNETASYVFRENMALTAIGCAVGLLLGKLLHIYVMHEVDIDLVSFDVHVRTVSYLLSVILTFLFTWVVNRIMSGKLDKINMAESLKSVD